jgi:NADPH-dependent 2,4-dienoyl-CoA reductase/sulfur reductase-like enzyme
VSLEHELVSERKVYAVYLHHPGLVPFLVCDGDTVAIPPGQEDKGAREERLGNHLPGAHVIVVGGGLAGCCATIEAAKAGAKVTLIEKENRVCIKFMHAASR